MTKDTTPDELDDLIDHLVYREHSHEERVATKRYGEIRYWKGDEDISCKEALNRLITKRCNLVDIEARIDELSRLFDGYDAGKRENELKAELKRLEGKTDECQRPL